MAKTRKCPVCGNSVKLENLEEHVRRVHPREEVELDLSPDEQEEILEATRPEPIRISGTGIKWGVVVAAIVAIILTFAVLYRPPPGPIGEGDTAPDFTIATTTGATFTLSQYQGKVVLLDFMDADCSVCRQHTPDDLVPLYQQTSVSYPGEVIFLSIDVGWVGSPDTLEKVNQFMIDTGSSWSYALDFQNLDDLYGVSGTPTTFLVDTEGVVTYHHVGGGATGAILFNEIQQILGG